MFGWILIVIGIIFAVLGIGGSVKLQMKGLGGIIISGMAGVILIIAGVLFLSAGI
jgi:hypothetical protein